VLLSLKSVAIIPASSPEVIYNPLSTGRLPEVPEGCSKEAYDAVNSQPMVPTGMNTQTQCREQLDRFFASYGDAKMQKTATTVLCFLAAGGEPMRGKPEGWAAGIVYALANRDRRACGVPGMLNAKVEEFFGVTMSTIRKRAAQVERTMTI